MDISADSTKTTSERPGFISDGMQFVLGVFRRLMGILTLTEADRMKAGIHIRRQGT